MSKNKIFPKIAKIEYLAKIPEHWKVWKISNAFKKVGSGTTPDSGNPAFYNGDIPWVNTSELRENIITDTSAKVTEYALKQHPILTLYPPNTLLIAMYGATIGRLGILGITACTNQACCALAEPIHINSKFCFYWLQSKRNEIIADSSGGGQKNINQEKIRSLRISAPSLHEQHLIADYLDRETTQIDNLIAAKEQMLTLLEEKREALISHAVTRGLDPNVTLKASDAPWFDKTPQHWSVERLKLVIKSVASGVSVNASDQPIEKDGFGVLKTSSVSRGRFIPNENKSVWDTEFKRLACPVRQNSIIISRMNTPSLVGESGYVEFDYPNLFLPDRLWQIKFNEERIYVPFMALLISSKEARHALSSKATGTSPSMKNLAIEEMSSLPVPIPPIGEQIAIHEAISQQDNNVYSLKHALINSIALLKERRSALITAAVTGQINIQEMSKHSQNEVSQ
ncbi:MAG: restriction endonuclease subunit S [Pseudanabaena sp.]